MREVVKRHPEALYLILGETHPVVRRHEGESYRESLQEMVREFGLQYNVQLVDRYFDFDELVGYLAATDIYLTPYLNPVQIVSGTLAYAVGCGKAIVSTPYLVRPGAAGAQSRLPVRVPRLGFDRSSADDAARRSGVAARDRATCLSLRSPDDLAARRGEYGSLFSELAPPRIRSSW